MGATPAGHSQSLVSLLVPLIGGNFFETETGKFLFVIVQQIVILLALYLLTRSRSASSSRSYSIASRTLNRAALAIGALSVSFSAALTLLTRPGIYSADESVYRFQANLLQHGRVWSPALPVPPEYLSFIYYVIRDGRWAGKYPIGWPLLLAAVQPLHLEALINPILGALLLWMTYRLGSKLRDESTGAIAAIFLAMSPMFTLNNIGYLSHTFSGAVIAAAFLLLWEAHHRASMLCFAGMSVCLAIALLIRPISAVAAALVLIPASIHMLKSVERPLRWALTGMLPQFAGCTLLLWHNRAITGSIFVPPYATARGTHLIPTEVPHTAAQWAFSLFITAPLRIEYTLVGMFALVIPLAVYGYIRHRHDPSIVPIACLLPAFLLAYCSNREASASPFGERYFYEAAFSLALLAAIGWTSISTQGGDSGGWSPLHFRRPKPILLIVAVALAIPPWIYMTAAEFRLRTPYQQLENAERQLSNAPVVAFIKGGDGLKATDDNPNRIEWLKRKVFFLPDPGSALERIEIAKLLGVSRIATLEWSGSEKQIQVSITDK